MAKGDVKRTRSRGYGGSGGWADYDDEGRGVSKRTWEEFERGWMGAGFKCSWLFERTSDFLAELIIGTTRRYKLRDGPLYWDREGTYSHDLEKAMRQDDSRIARLVKKHCGEDTWYKFHLAIIEAYDQHLKERKQYRRERGVRWDEEAKAREAEQLIVLEEETRKIRQEVEMTAGLLRADFHEALRLKEVYAQRNGDWLDDPVAAYTTGYGFGEEIEERAGVKLQITVSLDMSNSMYHNDIHVEAAEAFRTLYLAAEALAEENPGDVFVGAFTFSQGDSGKYAQLLSEPLYSNVPKELRLGVMEGWRNPRWGKFSGEDTWVYPLFEEIEKWECEHSDSGAIRLDIVITDAVLEHPKDIREASKIQERRDGTLQSVFLNLLPESQWVNSTLPRRCVQYPATVDNIAGLLRNLVAEFVSVYV